MPGNMEDVIGSRWNVETQCGLLEVCSPVWGNGFIKLWVAAFLFIHCSHPMERSWLLPVTVVMRATTNSQIKGSQSDDL